MDPYLEKTGKKSVKINKQLVFKSVMLCEKKISGLPSLFQEQGRRWPRVAATVDGAPVACAVKPPPQGFHDQRSFEQEHGSSVITRPRVPRTRRFSGQCLLCNQNEVC